MKHLHKHVIARLLIGSFLILGVGFWMTRFVVDAAIRNVGIGNLPRDNHTAYLNSGFWDAGPTSGDIVAALYGTGNDTTTVYTENWDGYTSGSCLNGGMTVEFTGGIPTTLDDNTIYVVASGTYNTTSSIWMGNCSALISSGIVTISGSVGSQAVLAGDTVSNIIVEKIRINGNTTSEEGIRVSDATNFCINEFKAYNQINGIKSTNSFYGKIRNSESYDNLYGIALYTSTDILIDTIDAHDNSFGAKLDESTGNIFSGGILSGNLGGIYFTGGGNNQILSTTINNNSGAIGFLWSHGNTISGTILSGNGEGISLWASDNSVITNSTYYYSGSHPSIYAISIYNSSGSIIQMFSGNKNIEEEQDSGLFMYTTYDNYTQINNQILLGTYNGMAILTGTTPSGYSFSSYFDYLEVNELSLSGVNLFTVGGDDRDGTIYRPTQITTGAKKANLGETGINLISGIYDTIEVISGLSYLTMDGGTGIISYTIGSGTSGQHLSIMRSIDGSTWTSNSPSSGCILDSNKLCTFSTTGDIKLFAFGAPGLFFTGATQSGTPVQSGGYYNTGVMIYFTGSNLSGATLNGNAYSSGALITGDGIKTFTLTDMMGNSTGMVFTVDTTNPILTGAFSPASGSTVSNDNTITFTWTATETNKSGYTIYVTHNSSIYASGNTTTESGALLVQNNTGYARYVIATDKAGNTGTFSPVPFTVNVPLSGATIALSGSNLVTSGGAKYTATSFPVYIRAPKNCAYTITGNDITTVAGNYTGTAGITVPVSPTGSDGSRIIYVHLYTGSETFDVTLSGYIDTTWPEEPGLVSPITGYVSSGSLPLVWTTANDTGVGLSGYKWLISSNTGFTSIVLSGFTISTSANPNTALLGVTTGTFYRRVRALDKLGWIRESSYRDFYYSGLDLTPDDFSFDDITDADLEEYYGSDPITITGLSANTPVLAVIDAGALHISGHMVGTTGLVQNGWEVSIELESSDEYNETVESTLTINGVSDTFSVETKDEETTDVEKLAITDVSNEDPDEDEGVDITIEAQDSDEDIVDTYEGTVKFTVEVRDDTNNERDDADSDDYDLDLTSYTFDENDDEGEHTFDELVTFLDDTKDYRLVVYDDDDDNIDEGRWIFDFGNGYNAQDDEEDVDIETNLSTMQRLQIASIFLTLKDVYSSDSLRTTFFTTLLEALESRINTLDEDDEQEEIDALQYLYDLIENYLGDDYSAVVSNSDWHVAPNGRVYKVTYNSTAKTYTSPDLTFPKTFTTLAAMTSYIDLNNGGSGYGSSVSSVAWNNATVDSTWQSAPYVAPNGKSYRLFKTTDGRYSSYNFVSAKYFISIETVKSYIYSQNR